MYAYIIHLLPLDVKDFWNEIPSMELSNGVLCFRDNYLLFPDKVIIEMFFSLGACIERREVGSLKATAIPSPTQQVATLLCYWPLEYQVLVYGARFLNKCL